MEVRTLIGIVLKYFISIMAKTSRGIIQKIFDIESQAFLVCVR